MGKTTGRWDQSVSCVESNAAWSWHSLTTSSLKDKGLTMKKLYEKLNQGTYRKLSPEEIREAALEYLNPLVGQAIRSPADTEKYLMLEIGHLEYEQFSLIFLDNRHRILGFQKIFRGTIDGTSVYPREVVKEALLINAAAIICAHNHPSGVAEPSQADERITKRLKAALELVDIRLLDHIIVAGSNCTSLAARGML